MSDLTNLFADLRHGVHCWGCGGGGSYTPPPPPVTLQTINVTPANSSIAPGIALKFTATGNYSDGSTKDVSSFAQWTSTNAAVATVDGTGAATTKGTGNTTIQAALNSV